MSWESLVTDRYSLWNDGFEHHSREDLKEIRVIRHLSIVVLGHSVDPTLKSLWSIWS